MLRRTDTVTAPPPQDEEASPASTSSSSERASRAPRWSRSRASKPSRSRQGAREQGFEAGYSEGVGRAEAAVPRAPPRTARADRGAGCARLARRPSPRANADLVRASPSRSPRKGRPPSGVARRPRRDGRPCSSTRCAWRSCVTGLTVLCNPRRPRAACRGAERAAADPRRQPDRASAPGSATAGISQGGVIVRTDGGRQSTRRSSRRLERPAATCCSTSAPPHDRCSAERRGREHRTSSATPSESDGPTPTASAAGVAEVIGLVVESERSPRSRSERSARSATRARGRGRCFAQARRLPARVVRLLMPLLGHAGHPAGRPRSIATGPSADGHRPGDGLLGARARRSRTGRSTARGRWPPGIRLEPVEGASPAEGPLRAARAIRESGWALGVARASTPVDHRGGRGQRAWHLRRLGRRQVDAARHDIARNTAASVNVIGLIGRRRGREVREFIEARISAPEGLGRAR